MVEGPLLARCACGWSFTGSVDDVVRQTQEHARRVHNMKATREQILAQAVPVQREGLLADAERDQPD
jgi:hypothetical protein